ncbi:hypothetical protein D778_02318 [Xanthomarina gelatinilytica]|jgi:hypothetical protein|uniref:Tetratricopeptide repeat protein n=1 Tax=Xanthomarina gelatinilytica TaxID=1137281 RepID=M7ND50_9FLAO|nr:hypothetical protein [Xanthomarina gelatinilytica]EMQ96428.1 hypothetical protein D778_02318 [Xanthomarina gelatinilytica]MCB0387521.1 hypothetical protein [Winogradskyella sp.]
MNQKDFIEILQSPKSITAENTLALQAITEEFPYFQSARALYLKGLKNKESFKYNQELKTTAAYTSDRSILFDFITSEEFLQNEISQFIKQNTAHLKDIPVEVEDISVNKSVSIDDTLKQQIKDTTGVLDPDLFQPKKEHANFKLQESKETANVTQQETPAKTASPDTILQLGKPLQFDQSETHSFNEWLKLTRFKPIERSNTEDIEAEKTTTNPNKSQNTRDKKFDLIDKFISKNPRLKPQQYTSNNANLAEEQMIQPESLMTETLARIYLEQKNYKKAIQSYNILSLKYPEKSGFFADQIKAIKKLQEQNNK